MYASFISNKYENQFVNVGPYFVIVVRGRSHVSSPHHVNPIRHLFPFRYVLKSGVSNRKAKRSATTENTKHDFICINKIATLFEDKDTASLKQCSVVLAKCKENIYRTSSYDRFTIFSLNFAEIAENATRACPNHNSKTDWEIVEFRKFTLTNMVQYFIFFSLIK